MFHEINSASKSKLFESQQTSFQEISFFEEMEILFVSKCIEAMLTNYEVYQYKINCFKLMFFRNIFLFIYKIHFIVFSHTWKIVMIFLNKFQYISLV